MRILSKLKKGLNLLYDMDKLKVYLASKGLYTSISDEEYLKMAFKIRMGRELNLDNPRTYSDKLQWLKLYDRNPLYTIMVDKYLVKQYVADKIGGKYIIPTLGVWDSPEDIDFKNLPNQFVLKCNHNSGGLCICKDKEKINIQKVKNELSKSLKYDYYLSGREWPYKNVPRKIIAEKYMEDDSDKELRDYKYFCFDGQVKALFIATERQNRDEPYFDFFDENFNHLDFTNGHPNAPVLPHKPRCFEEMKYLARELSKGIPQVRVDFYEVNGRVYFGELTLFHWSGMKKFEPEEWDYKFGEWIQLPRKWV